MRTKRLGVVGLVMGLIVGGTVAFAGVALAGNSPPTSVNTCTRVNHHGVYGKPKVTNALSCPGTKLFQAWKDARYLDLMNLHTSQTSDFTDLDLSGLVLPALYSNPLAPVSNFHGDNFTDSTLVGAEYDDFSAANFTGVYIVGDARQDGTYTGSNFDGANFTNARFFDWTGGASDFQFTNSTFLGAIWSNTICPDQTDSNSDGSTCVGHGIP
jgi:uncharacterized protein YjbI with pentapeptide repeats